MLDWYVLVCQLTYSSTVCHSHLLVQDEKKKRVDLLNLFNHFWFLTSMVPKTVCHQDPTCNRCTLHLMHGSIDKPQQEVMSQTERADTLGFYLLACYCLSKKTKKQKNIKTKATIFLCFAVILVFLKYSYICGFWIPFGKVLSFWSWLPYWCLEHEK